MRDPIDQTWLDEELLWLSAPIQSGLVWTLEGVVGLFHDYVFLVGVEEENKALKLRVEELERSVAWCAECDAQNARLRSLVNRADELSRDPLVSARVISFGTSLAAQVIRIDAGRNAGVEVGDAVVAGAGLVGRVVALVGGYSEVQLLTDARAAVDVVVRRSRARAILRGQGSDSFYVLEHLIRTADVAEGDQVVTSGLGDLFPSGLPVGSVSSVTSPKVGVFRSAEVLPAVSFDLLEDVLVVLRSRHRKAAAPDTALVPAEGAAP